MFSLAQFDYTLPSERIAHSPAEPRDSSRLLVLHRDTGDIEHAHFKDLPQFLDTKSLLVRNNTKVIPARLFGQKHTGGQCELLLIHAVNNTTWECLTKPGLKLGATLSFPNSSLTATCTKVNGYTRFLEFNQTGESFWKSLNDIGHTPVPPYIHWEKTDEAKLREIYQTTFAKIAGSVAAPTAGLHFTGQVDADLQQKGIAIEELTLHVGLGTFLPLQLEQIAVGKLHHEQYELTTAAAQHINAARAQGKKIVAVGTTTTRVLETCSGADGVLHAGSGETELFIQPGDRFHCVDALITNFHLPQSSLLMLVSAFVSKPNTSHEFTDFANSIVGRAYATAIREQYRFYSFGDAMLIL